jgi:hypothetical protein
LHDLIRANRTLSALGVNTGRSVISSNPDLPISRFPSGQISFLRQSDVLNPGQMETNGSHLATGTSAARDHASYFRLSQSSQSSRICDETKARLIYNSDGLEGLVAENDEEMQRITEFIEQARRATEIDYQQHGLFRVLSR